MAGLHAERPLFEKYELGKLLGCGAFAKVYHARDLRTNQSVAIKVIRKKRLSSPVNTKREISIMRRLRHPNIVRLHEVLATKSTIFYAMEYVKGGELFARVAKGRLPEDLARRFFRQLISAVGYCHSRGVFHRDLKLENLLLDENNNVKVTDFGLSAEAHCADNGLLKTVCGTPAYVAPEILVKKGYGGAGADTWSCGVILFVLTAGYLPFNDPNLMCMYRKIYNGVYKCPRWMSSGLKHLLSRLLDTNPETRITINEVLSDPWFNQGSEPEVNFNPAEEIDELLKSGEVDEKSTLNAFHLISFSSGLSLSGLFEDGCESDRVVCSDSAGRVVDRIKLFAESQEARVINAKESRVQLFWPSSKVCVEVEIHKLTDKMIVVEAHRRGGDSVVYQEMWQSKLRHAIVGSGEIDNDDEMEPSEIANLYEQ